MSELEKNAFNHYTIQCRLARGGMSSVYLAHDEQQRTVAIKVVDGDFTEYVARFQHEVAALKALKHPHILPIIDDGERHNWHYYVMPYIKHGNLRERLSKGPLSQEEAGDILKQVASALQFAHEHGILHRDIKASNILLEDREHGLHAFLADFGLAKGIDETVGLTLTGCIIGTPEYMAPELADEPATTSSDIYALGILLYQMLTGSVPFKGSTPMSIYCKHIQEQPTPPSHLNLAISMPVEAVVLRALAKDPQARFQSVSVMVEAYYRALNVAGQVIKSVAISPIYGGTELAAPTIRLIPAAPVGRPRRRIHPGYAVLAVLFFLILVPMTLGFNFGLHLNGPALQAPIVRGASAEYAGQLAAVTPTKTVTTKKSTTSVVHYINQPTRTGQWHTHKRKHKD